MWSRLQKERSGNCPLSHSGIRETGCVCLEHRACAHVCVHEHRCMTVCVCVHVCTCVCIPMCMLFLCTCACLCVCMCCVPACKLPHFIHWITWALVGTSNHYGCEAPATPWDGTEMGPRGHCEELERCSRAGLNPDFAPFFQGGCGSSWAALTSQFLTCKVGCCPHPPAELLQHFSDVCLQGLPAALHRLVP